MHAGSMLDLWAMHCIAHWYALHAPPPRGHGTRSLQTHCRWSPTTPGCTACPTHKDTAARPSPIAPPLPAGALQMVFYHQSSEGATIAPPPPCRSTPDGVLPSEQRRGHERRSARSDHATSVQGHHAGGQGHYRAVPARKGAYLLQCLSRWEMFVEIVLVLHNWYCKLVYCNLSIILKLVLVLQPDVARPSLNQF